MGTLKGDEYRCDYCMSTFHRSELDPVRGRREATKDEGTEEEQVVREVHHHYFHDEKPDRLSAGLGCLIFLFFPLGWIIYFLYRDSSPGKARTAMIIAAVMTVLFLAGIAGVGGR